MEHLKKIGNVLPKKSVDIKKSRIGLGFEKLDRDAFNPEKSYPFVGETGVKWARLQSGWQKTERQKGVYDFAWLDSIVDNLLGVGVEPWLCLCYGNALYTPAAETVYGAVGCPPIHTEEEQQAWADYVLATATHFKGRIHYYEVWNEPDGRWCWKHGPNAEELADFNIATAKACKSADPTCEVIGLATCHGDDSFNEVLFQKNGADYIDAVSYHSYVIEDIYIRQFFDVYDAYRKKYAPNLKIIQGESGTQSRYDGMGAMRGAAWTPLKQAKYLLRHLVIDLAAGVEFTSYFSCMDMAEALNGVVGDLNSISDFGYFGVVGAEFDENAKATGNYFKKPSFYTLQTLTSILCEEYTSVEIPVEAVLEHSNRMYGPNFDFGASNHYFFRRPDNSTAMVYWVSRNILTETFEGETSFYVTAEGLSDKITLIDLLDGSIYQLNDQQVALVDGKYYFRNVPITDSPLLIQFGNFYKEKF